jgi:putative nucleotidyltransferase with HDIG domain
LERSPDISGALKSLAHALQAKDPYTAGHSMRVAAIAKAMAEDMGLPPEEVRQLVIGAELHDIGKIGVPEHLLHKPGRLSDAEYQQVMQHTVMGEEIVAPLLGTDSTVRDVVRWHHEHMDGWGGPDGLEGDTIPLAARIVAVADAFDAMTTARPYRRALTTVMTLAELRREAESHFDPACVDVLETLLPAKSALAAAS